MATVVGGLLVPHNPLMFQAPDAVTRVTSDRVHAAFEEAARRLEAMAPDVVVIVGADHYVLFGPTCLPRYLIGFGDVAGPLERFAQFPKRQYPSASDLARHLVHHGADAGFDWAVARSITVDHSVALPYELLVGARDTPLVPVYLASGVEPILPMRRACAVGEEIGTAVSAYEGDERVAVIGSGGISHWVGLPRMGDVNPDFDTWVLERVAAGDIDALAALRDDDVLERAGNGALEIRHFVCAMAAVGDCRGDVIDYVPSPEWITGLGFVELVPQGNR